VEDLGSRGLGPACRGGERDACWRGSRRRSTCAVWRRFREEAPRRPRPPDQDHHSRPARRSLARHLTRRSARSIGLHFDALDRRWVRRDWRPAKEEEGGREIRIQTNGAWTIVAARRRGPRAIAWPARPATDRGKVAPRARYAIRSRPIFALAARAGGLTFGCLGSATRAAPGQQPGAPSTAGDSRPPRTPWKRSRRCQAAHAPIANRCQHVGEQPTVIAKAGHGALPDPGCG